jgi:hypothetical protein
MGRPTQGTYASTAYECPQTAAYGWMLLINVSQGRWTVISYSPHFVNVNMWGKEPHTSTHYGDPWSLNFDMHVNRVVRRISKNGVL